MIKKLITNDSKSLHTVGSNKKKDITLSLLKSRSKKSNVAITGATLCDAALQVHANGKKALAIGMQYLDSRKDHPSGTTNEDFYAHVLREMYKLSKGHGDSAAVSLIDDNVDSNNGVAESDVDSQVTASDAPIEDAAAGVATGDNTEEMFETFPNGRVFKGFSCFVLYGPRAPEAQQSVLFQQNNFLRPNKDKKSAGRNASHKEELEQKNKEREASTSRACSTTISARTDVVFAVQQDAAKQQRDYKNKVLILYQMIKSLTEEIGSAERQAERSCPLYDPNHEDWV
jgi:hypothetical protein